MLCRTWPELRGLILIVTLLSAFGGCTSMREYVHNGFKVGPNYETPEAPVAEHWIDASDVRVRTEPDDLSQWWKVFNDPVLDALIADAYRQNLSVRDAGLRVLAARTFRAITVGTLFPGNQGTAFNNLSGFGNLNANFDTHGTATPPGAMSIVDPNPQNATGAFTHQQTARLSLFGVVELPQAQLDTWSLGFNSNWELDFWGRFRRAVEMSNAKLDAAVEYYDQVLVTLLSDVADNYVQVRTYQREIAIAQHNAKVQRKILNDATLKKDAGVATLLDVDQATATLAQIEAQIPLFERLERHAMNRLCVLLGTPPQDLRGRVGAGPIPTVPAEVTVGIPAELLARRPDVRQAEREAAAQAQTIGIAKADLYPYIAIMGSMGYQANQFPELFDSRAFMGSVGPTFRWNLLNYGRILNSVRLQEVYFRESIITYQNKVLQAGEEVENGLIDFLRGKERVQKLQVGVTALEDAVERVMEKYNRGAVDYTPVALIVQDLVRQQDILTSAQGETVRGLIQIYRALGGGWQIRLEPAENLPVTGELSPPEEAVSPATVPTPAPEPLKTLPAEEKAPLQPQPAAAPKP